MSPMTETREQVLTESLDERLAGASTEAQHTELHLLDLLILIAKYRRPMLVITIGTLVLSLLVTIFWPSTYTAETRILPPQQPGSILNSLMGQLGPLAGLVGTAGKDLAQKGSTDTYVAILQSRSIGDNLVARFHLQDVYHEQRVVDARHALEDRSKIASASKDNVITISVNDRDPTRAAQLANGYVDELFKVNQRLAITEASQRRKFFENELNENKEKLASAEIELSKLQENTGLLQLDAQSRVIMESVGTLQANIAAKRVQLQTMESYATSNNPDVVILRDQISAMEGQLKKLQTGPHEGAGDVLVATGRVPEVGREYIRRMRELKYQEAMFEILSKQFEAAKIDEAKNAPVIQVLDPAVPPEKRSWPKAGWLLPIGFLLGIVLSFLYALINEALKRWKTENTGKLAVLQRAFRA